MKLKLYTTHCPKCKVIENKLNSKHVEFEMIDDVERINEAGITELPVLEVEGKQMSFLEANKYVNGIAEAHYETEH